jgi:hypothetical protein
MEYLTLRKRHFSAEYDKDSASTAVTGLPKESHIGKAVAYVRLFMFNKSVPVIYFTQAIDIVANLQYASGPK